MYENNKTGKILLEAGILIMVVNLLCTVGIWQSISNGWKVISDSKLFLQAFIESGGRYAITYLNQESIYLSFLSVIFSFLGNREEVVSIINLVLQLAGVGFFYLSAKKIYGYVGSIVFLLLSAVFSVFFYPIYADTSMHMIWCLTGFLFWICSKFFSDISGMYLKQIFIGILLGISCYVDISAWFLLVMFVVFTLVTRELHIKEKGLQLLCFFLCVISGYFCMFYLWNHFVFDSKIFSQWLQDKITYIAQPAGILQYSAIGIMAFLGVILYGIKCRRQMTEKLTVQEEKMQATGTEIKAMTKSDVQEPVIDIEEIQQTIMQAAVTESKGMQESDAQESVAKVEEIQKKAAQVSVIETKAISKSDVQEPVIDIEKKQESVIEIKEVQEKTVLESEEQTKEKKKIKYIENPLPLPKKHVKKEMTYAFEPSADQMHYDLNNYSVDDDYDLKTNI